MYAAAHNIYSLVIDFEYDTNLLNILVGAGGAAAEARRAFGSMAAAARDSLDDIRDEDDSRSDSDFSDRQIYGQS